MLPPDRFVTSSAIHLKPVALDSGGARMKAKSSFFAPGFGWLCTGTLMKATASTSTAAMA